MQFPSNTEWRPLTVHKCNKIAMVFGDQHSEEWQFGHTDTLSTFKKPLPDSYIDFDRNISPGQYIGN